MSVTLRRISAGAAILGICGIALQPFSWWTVVIVVSLGIVVALGADDPS